MDPAIREPRIQRLRAEKEVEEEEKQTERKKLVSLQERIGSLRSKLVFNQWEEEDIELSQDCVKLRKRWIQDYPEIFKEVLGEEDRIEIEPVVFKRKEGFENISCHSPTTPKEVSPYLEAAARKEIARMIKAGQLREVHDYTPYLSRGFFVEKHSEGGEVKVRLVADYREVNKILQRPEVPLENSHFILRRLPPTGRVFAAVDMSSGFSQLPLADESKELFTIITPYGKFEYQVVPQGTAASPEYFEIHTSPKLKDIEDIYKNVDDIMGVGDSMEGLDEKMRRVFDVCKERNIKLNPSKLQVGTSISFGGVQIEAARGQGTQASTVTMSPLQSKLDEFLDLETPTNRKHCLRIAGLCAQMKKFVPGLQIKYPMLRELTKESVRFHWTAMHQEELENLKRALKERIKVSPVDITKELILIIDSASRCGTAYFLVQPRTTMEKPEDGFNIISCDSSLFVRSKLDLNPFEAEAAGLVFAACKEDWLLKSAPVVHVWTDCMELRQTYEKRLEDIENRRVQAMLKKIQHINMNIVYIKGIKNCTADFRSRAPRQVFEAITEHEVPTRVHLGLRSVRAQKEKREEIDPRLEELARAGANSPSYSMMIHHMEEDTEFKMIEEGSELRQLGPAIKKSLSLMCLEGGKLIIRNSNEVYVPRECRPEFLAELHSTHLSCEGMKRLCRKRLFWPGLSEDLEQLYKACEPCKQLAKSKPNVPGHNVTVVPSIFEAGAPGEYISMDYMSYGKHDLAIMKDRFSGLMQAYLTKDKTAESAIKALQMWSHKFGFPTEVRSDGGPCFKARFSEYCQSMGIKHIQSSPYFSQSNGSAERSVGLLKHLMLKSHQGIQSRLLKQEELDAMTFRLNSHRDPKEGSPLEKFFGRGVRTYLPALNYRKVDHQALIAERKRKQERIAAKLGRRSAEHFQEGDQVRIQCPQSGRWTIKATVKTPRISEDGSINSWNLVKEDGKETIRNSRYMRFAPTVRTRAVFFEDEAGPGNDSETNSENEEPESAAESNIERAESASTQTVPVDNQEREPGHNHYTRRAAQGLASRMRWL